MKIKVSKIGGEILYEGEIVEFPFRIGRQKSCQAVVPDQAVSSEHAEISRDESGNFCVKDLNSRNGIFIGLEKIESQKISFPFRFSLGQEILVELNEENVSSNRESDVSPQKTWSTAKLQSRVSLVKMKAKLPFHERTYYPEFHHSLCDRLNRTSLKAFVLCFLMMSLLFGLFDLFSNGEVFSQVISTSLRRQGTILFGALVFALLLAILVRFFRGIWVFRSFAYVLFVSGSSWIIYYEFIYPFLLSKLLAVVFWLVSLVGIPLGLWFLFSVFYRGFFPASKNARASISVLLLTAVFSGLLLKQMASRKSFDAFVDIYRRSEAPNRMLAGISVSTQQWKTEIQQEYLKHKSSTNEEGSREP